MCELLGISSNIPATLNLTMSKLAAHGGPPACARDGWGVAYYKGKDTRLIKDTGPVDQSKLVQIIEQYDLRSEIVVAHIRKATNGSITYANTQPFERELAGRKHVFAHNGGFPKIHNDPRFQSTDFVPVGDTDSERAYCSLMQRLREIWHGRDAIPSLSDRFDIISIFAAEIRGLGPSNFLYSDGEFLFAHGDRRKQAATGKFDPPGLVYLEQECCSDDIRCENSGLSLEGVGQSVTLFASVPLSKDVWTPVSEGELIAIAAGKICLIG
jgi:glutamine amidotransferase